MRAAPTFCDGREKAVTAIGELAKSFENKTNNRVRLWSIPCPAFFYRERLSVVGVRRTEGRVSVTASQSLVVVQLFPNL
jgi:hypothetical protein